MSNKKILFLHHDTRLCQLLKPILEKEGYQLVSAKAGEDPAVAILREQPGQIWGDASLTGTLMPKVAVPAVENRKSAAGTALSAESGDSSIPPVPKAGGPKSTLEYEKLQDFQNMFLILKTKYARTLTERVASLENAVMDARYFPTEQKRQEVLTQTHKITGTASNYGFHNLVAAIKGIEETIAGLKVLNEADSTPLWAELEKYLAAAKIEAQLIAVEVSQAIESIPSAEVNPVDRTQPPVARILVIDEDEQFLSVVERLCKRSQINVIKAKTAEQALSEACVHLLDAALICVDQSVPESSFKLARDLRELPGYDALPMAFISNGAVAPDKVQAAHAGASVFLDKSIKPEALESSVQYLISIRQSGRPKILIVDDDPHFADSLALVLRFEGCLVRALTDPSKVLDVLAQAPPDIVLLDVKMPGLSGFEVCKQIRALPRWKDLPVIFLTADTGVDARVAAFRSGGDDYLPKPFINEELIARVKVRLEHARLLKERSDRDPVTGLLLRRPFMEQLNGFLSECERKSLTFSICLLHVDHFQHLIQTCGHLSGDRVLAGLGQLLGKRFRADDLRGRWGGEQFILAFKYTTKQTMYSALSRLHDEFKATTFEGDSGQLFRSSFSGGLSTYPEDGKTIPELLAGADRRLEQAREAANKRVVGVQGDRRMVSS